MKRQFLIAALLFASMMLSGCVWGLLGRALVAEEIALLTARGGLARASVAGMRLGIGGEAVAATRMAQANIGSIIASDFAAGRLASSSLRLQIGEGVAATTGRATMRSGTVNVAFADGQVMRVTTPKPSQSATGLFSEHYVGAQRVSYARLSPDGVRYDYFVRNAYTGKFDRALYALRDPSGQSIAFFGPNHSYLGKAIYRAQTGTGVGLAAGAAAYVTMADFQSTPYGVQCSQELVNLRLTYFNMGEIPEQPDRFWESLYNDCSKNTDVSNDYQGFKMRNIYAIEDRQQKLTEAKRFLSRFPRNSDAVNLVRDLEASS
jgi:prepilin-type processing-associated H-X9-DG protein